jgi:hypothetical protein
MQRLQPAVAPDGALLHHFNINCCIQPCSGPDPEFALDVHLQQEMQESAVGQQTPL